MNAGRVDQNGLELGATVRPLTGMQVTGAYTYSDFTYRDFVSGGQIFSGRTVPGVPAHNAFAEVSYRAARGLSMAFEIQRVGPFFLDDLNTASNEPYVVANLRVGYDLRLGRSFELSPWPACRISATRCTRPRPSRMPPRIDISIRSPAARSLRA